MFDIIVIGGTNVDIKAKTTRPHIAATSNPGTVSVTPGGVARNVRNIQYFPNEQIRLYKLAEAPVAAKAKTP